MQLVVWNSRGNEWDVFWTTYINPLVTHEDVLGLLVESGRPPWSVDVVHNNNMYEYQTNKNATVNQHAAAHSALCQAIDISPYWRKAFWFPWVQTLDTGNPRCSLGGVIKRSTNKEVKIDRMDHPDIKRPVVRIFISRPTFGTKDIVLLQVHLTATDATARQELSTLMGTITKLIPTNTPAFIIGDLNIDLQAGVFPVNAPWRIVRTGVATHSGGSELDWGLLYDPHNWYRGIGVNVLLAWNAPANGSDHSMLLYNVPLPN